MPGMGNGLRTTDPTVVAAFHSALFKDLLVIGAFLALLAVAWTVFAVSALRSGNSLAVARSGARLSPEPLPRRVLRISFGLLWLLDGLLQLQPGMPLGMPSQVIDPTAAASPAWVRDIVNFGATTWTNHPVQAAAAAVYIQLGLALWLLVVGRGGISRLGGAASALWAATVWVFGESFGGIFAPGASFLFGMPGAALLYVVAGVLVSLPDGAWIPRLGRFLLRGFGLFLVGMALLQAWPGRGFWTAHSGTLSSMVSQMALMPQPSVMRSIVSSFGSFSSGHAFAVNLVAVVLLAVIGAGLLVGRRPFVRATLPLAAAFFLSVWVLVQDCGFFGGVGTDPNSMLPLLAVVSCSGLLALRVPYVSPAEAPAQAAVSDGTGESPSTAGARDWTDHETPPAWQRPGWLPNVGRALLGFAAAGVVLVGAVPMGVASTNRTADPTLAEALAGSTNWTNGPTPNFSLRDQNGRLVSLASLRGKAVILTFLDPVCNAECPLIAQEMKGVNPFLGRQAGDVALVAIVVNPLYRAPGYVQAFDKAEQLGSVPNWHYLTGSLPQLAAVWARFGVTVSLAPAGGMVAHSDVAYVIDPSGRTREILSPDPGPGTAPFRASFSALLAQAAIRALHSG